MRGQALQSEVIYMQRPARLVVPRSHVERPGYARGRRSSSRDWVRLPAALCSNSSEVMQVHVAVLLDGSVL